MDQLADFEGKRVEVEVEGKRICGRVIRGPGRKHMLLEECGPVGDVGTGCHAKLSKLKVWRPNDLEGGTVLQELPCELVRKPRRRRKGRADWSKAVAVASGDPKNPPDDWEEGQLAWAETVAAARRRVERGRRAMMRALKAAAG